MPKSHLEELYLSAFYLEARIHGMLVEAPAREYVFCPGRRWRFDFAWPRFKLAVEIDGATFTGGRHGRGIGAHNDHDKLNAAAVLGWRVLRFDVRHLRDDPQDVFELTIRALAACTDCQPIVS
jgi:hypothetical protein